MNIHTNAMVETSLPERDGYIVIEIEEERVVCMYVCMYVYVRVECERDRKSRVQGIRCSTNGSGRWSTKVYIYIYVYTKYTPPPTLASPPKI